MCHARIKVSDTDKILFCLYLWPKRKSGHKIKREHLGSVTYSTDQETRVARYLLSLGSGRGGGFLIETNF